MKLPFNPTKEVEFKATVPVRVTKDGVTTITGTEERTYRLRFAMRELHRAEQFYGIKALANEDGRLGVNAIIQKLTDGSLDNLLYLFGTMASRERTIPVEEMFDVADADFNGLLSACYGLLGIVLPEPDPKGTAPTEAPPTEATTGV